MPTCSADLFSFAPVAGRAVVAGLDGGGLFEPAVALAFEGEARPQHSLLKFCRRGKGFHNVIAGGLGLFSGGSDRRQLLRFLKNQALVSH